MKSIPHGRLHEWHATRELLARLPGRLWDGMQLHEPPAPDVVLPSHKIGIEVTRLHPGGTRLKKQESTQDGVLARAAELYFAARHPWVEVRVTWSARYLRANRRKDDLAQEIADFVTAHLPGPNCEAEFNRGNSRAAQLPHGIERVTLRQYEPYGAVVALPYWHTSRGAAPPAIEASFIQERLTNKEAAVCRWLSQSFSELWVLILFGMGGPSGWGVLPASLSSHVFASSATRAFVMGVGNDPIELSLAPPHNELLHLPARPAS